MQNCTQSCLQAVSHVSDRTFLLLRFIRISRCSSSVIGVYSDSQAVLRGVILCCGTVICKVQVVSMQLLHNKENTTCS